MLMQPPEKKRGGYQMSLVIRRVGGLEGIGQLLQLLRRVIRRVGGLEDQL